MKVIKDLPENEWVCTILGFIKMAVLKVQLPLNHSL